MRLTLTRAICLFLLVGPLIAADPHSAENARALSVESVVGVWRMCYEPSFSGEIDDGYLVLMPDQTAAEVTQPCCDQGKIARSGRFEIEGSAVLLTWQSVNGAQLATPGTRRLNYLGEHKVMFWRVTDPPAARAVLAPAGSVNYGYARIF